MNQITHWLDGSNIYGSHDEETSVLRSNKDGLLAITNRGRGDSEEGLLPSCIEAEKPEDIEMCHGCIDTCFFAGIKVSFKWQKTVFTFYHLGDVRANEQHNLIVMHTVWMREHNRVAR